jgi:NAD(P)H dehydrogenase (quinone)
MKPSEARDREYALDHRLAALADTLTFRLVTAQPVDPIAAIVATLRDQRGGHVPSGPSVAPEAGDFEAAKAYLQRYAIADTLDQWMRRLLRTKPERPIEWSIEYFTDIAGGSTEPQQTQQHQPQSSRGGRVRSDSVSTAATTATTATTAVPPRRNANPRILVVYYSAYGHVEALATAAAEGARDLFPGAHAELRRVPETLSSEKVEQQSIQHDPSVPEATLADIGAADAIIFGFGARFGTAPAQVCALLETTGGLWARGVLIGKPAAMLISTGTQHGGHEMAAHHFMSVLLHHGMVIVGPTSKDIEGPPGTNTGRASGGGPYAAGTLAGTDGARTVTVAELEMARRLGGRVAAIAARITVPFR